MTYREVSPRARRLPEYQGTTEAEGGTVDRLGAGPSSPPADVHEQGDRIPEENTDDRYERIAELLEAARSGRPDGMDELVEELTPLLWHVARAQGLDHTSCADVVQTTWLNLLRSLAGIHTPSALTAWLVTTTKREAWRARDAQRQELPSAEEGFADSTVDEGTPDQQVLAADQRKRLWQAVHRLPLRCQELIRVVAFTPRPDYGVVAARLGMPRGSIGPTRGRCLAKLRDLLTSETEGGWV
ncbi:sigma-70 family RNA polymerase sigma factor [Kutzneria viridogrisea]